MHRRGTGEVQLWPAIQRWRSQRRILLAVTQRRRIGERWIVRCEISRREWLRALIDAAYERDQIRDRSGILVEDIVVATRTRAPMRLGGRYECRIGVDTEHLLQARGGAVVKVRSAVEYTE